MIHKEAMQRGGVRYTATWDYIQQAFAAKERSSLQYKRPGTDGKQQLSGVLYTAADFAEAGCYRKAQGL